MAGKNLKGLTVEIDGDTSGLSAALKDVDKKSRDLNGELKQINELLKLDPTNTEALAQKQKVLAEAISNTEKRLGTLREAERQAQEQFEKGEITEEQYRALQREILITEQKLKKLKKEAEDTGKGMGELGEESNGTKKKLKETGKESDKAKDKVEELDNSLVDAAKNGFTALAASATAAITAIVATAEASREYRTEMAKLNTAFTTSNHSTVSARMAYEELQSVIGETDQSVEAAQQIALLANSAEDVAKWSELAAGVVGRFGDALQPETFYEAANEVMKLGESTGAWTQMLEQSGVMTVEEFNKGLEKCKTAAEKQAYMLSVANTALGSAATQYKKTNAEVIRANAAAEDWNKAVADIGEEMEPVVTDIKEMGTALLKDAKKPMKEVADFVRSTLLPMLTKFSKWALNNLPEIGALIAGVAASVVLYKVAALSAELATKGLTVATILQQKAQAALNLIMNANPYVLVATAVVALTTAIAALCLATEETTEKVDPLTEAERELMEAADEAAEAFRDQQKATEDALKSATAQMDYTKSLADELFTLADASGRVKDEDEARANFILNELNEALGTEYKMVDGVIQKYGNLKQSIYEVIEAKRAQTLLAAYEEQYAQSLTGLADAYDNMILKEKDYQAQQEITKQKQYEASDAWAAYYEALNNADFIAAAGHRHRAEQAQASFVEEQKILNDLKGEYDKAADTYGDHVSTIETYEASQSAVLQKNYDTAVDLLTRKGGAYNTFAGTVDSETAEVLDTLQREAVQAGIKAKWTKEQFEKGVDGFTADMVTEAEEGYNEAMGEFETAYADAYSVGEDLTDGLTEGAEGKRSGLLAKARSLVSGFIKAARAEADSHSPSRKTMDLGEDLGEGAEIGIEKSTKGVERAAADQVSAVLDAYRAQEVAGQNALRSIAEQQASRAVAGQMTMASANGPMLEKILAAIEKGQVLMLDGDALVGATATKMDSALGRRHDLAAKGAI